MRKKIVKSFEKLILLSGILKEESNFCYVFCQAFQFSQGVGDTPYKGPIVMYYKHG